MTAYTLLEELSAGGRQWMPILLDLAVKGAAILSLAGIAALAMRRASAAARHLVWLLGMCSLLILPVLCAALPGWHVLPSWDTPAPPSAVAAPPAPIPALPTLASTPPATPFVVSPPSELSASPIPSPRPHPAVPSLAQLSWQAWALLIWSAGTLFLMAHIALGFVSLRWLERRSYRIVEGEWLALLLDLRTQLGIRRPVELLGNAQRTMPMTWGLWRTRLLLPDEAAGWTMDQRRAVLLHELAHVRRWDCLSQLAAQMACALYWMNPLTWLAWHRIQSERERACDDLVLLRSGAKASAYAQQLLQIASELPPVRLGAAAIAMARPGSLEGRLLAILDSTRNRKAMSWVGGGLAIALVMVTVLPLAMLRAGDSAIQQAGASQTRINELIYVLRHSVLFSRQDEWSAAIKELAEIGKPAVPALATELDRADSVFERSAIAFTLRAIGDRRAIPSLIRALPRSAGQVGSFGIIVDDADLHAFMEKNACWPSGRDELFAFNWPLTELDASLRKITGHSEGEIQAMTNAPADQAAADRVRAEIAERWKNWWTTNRRQYVSDADLATVEGRQVQGDPVETAGVAKFGPLFPAGPDVRLGPVNDLVLPAGGSIDVKSCLDLDSGRCFGELEGAHWTSDRDFIRWDRKMGVDVRAQGEDLAGFGVHAWVVDNALWDTLPEELGRRTSIDPGHRGPSSDFYPPRTEGELRLKPPSLPATFLFTTREGGRGILQILSYEKQPRGFHIRYRMFQSPRLPIARVTPLPAAPTSAGLSFGPERQVTLYDPQGDRDASLNFDSGRTFALPAGAFEAGYENWLNHSDADVIAVPAKTDDGTRVLGAIVGGARTGLQRVTPEAWGHLTPAEAIELSSRYRPGPPLLQALAIFPSAPQTGVFRTRKGTVGLVQIVEASRIAGKEGAVSIKLQYKAIQGAGNPADATSPSTKPATTQSSSLWGPATEGVALSLHATKSRWQAGETIALTWDVRNNGQRQYLQVPTGDRMAQLEVDGVWYVWWPVEQRGARLADLGIGQVLENQSITLSPNWRTALPEELEWHPDGFVLARPIQRKSLDLSSGRHTVRVAVILEPSRVDTGGGMRVISEPVEIEAAGASPSTAPSSDIAPKAPLNEPSQSGLRDLSGTWTGERDGVKAKVIFDRPDSAVWYLETPQTRAWNRLLRPVDVGTGGVVELHLDYFTPAGKEQSVVMGTLRKDNAGTMLLTVLPAATTINPDYVPVANLALKRADLSLDAHVLGLDGKPGDAGEITFWRAVSPLIDPSKLPDPPKVWKDPAAGRAWETCRNVSGAGGSATATDLDVGDYRVTAMLGRKEGSPVGVSEVIHLDGTRKQTEVTVQLERGPALDIDVVDAHSNAVLDGAEIVLTRPDGLPVVSWASGRWAVLANGGKQRFACVAPGVYTLSVSKPAWYFGDSDYVLKDGPMKIVVGQEDQAVTVRMEPRQLTPAEVDQRWPWMVTGKVTDEGGRPMQGVAVHAACGEGTLPVTGHALSGADGRYTLRFRGGIKSMGLNGRWHEGLQAAIVTAQKEGYSEENLGRQGKLAMADEMPANPVEWAKAVVVPGRPVEVDFVMVPSKEERSPATHNAGAATKRAWETLGSINADMIGGTATFAGTLHVTGTGQDAQGEAFVTCLCKAQDALAAQYDVVAVGEDGRQLNWSSFSVKSPAGDVVVLQFNYRARLAELETFLIRSRPVSRGAATQPLPANREAITQLIQRIYSGK